ncbi:thioesterase domain-containing protein (plasmid) [Nostoc sp. UHCC 0302]|uniref:thioesterase domain-containing protein n=1 Tax=Nostoc sp. UHCC 0302 TaxID=3134896 RepID=UPI00311CB19F
MILTEVEEYLHQHIPISKQMAVSVVSIDETGIILSAPLLPNINHSSTVFGGSISTLGILSAWTLVNVRLQELSIKSRIVIKSNTVKYLKPIEGDFQSHCISPVQQNWQQFVEGLSNTGKGKIILNADIIYVGICAAKFEGEYVALKL